MTPTNPTPAATVEPDFETIWRETLKVTPQGPAPRFATAFGRAVIAALAATPLVQEAEPVATVERKIVEALRANGLSLMKTALGYSVESLGPLIAEVEYAPGEWFKAKSVDEMRAFFLSRLPAIREAAQGCGYAIGVHGSERRDFDLIAVPWRDGCDSPDALARAIAIAACGLTRQGAYEWEEKPLGRLAVSIPICWCDRWADDMAGAGHIDLSVMAPNSAQIARLTIERDDAISDAKEIRARWNDAENEFAAERATGVQATEVASPVVEAAIELVEAARAVISRWDSPQWKDVLHTAVFINRLRNALATPSQQEDAQPVGWVVEYELGVDFTAHKSLREEWERTGRQPFPVYRAAPPARSSVPLTDEQIWRDDEIMSRNAVGGLPMHDLIRLVRAIEAAHGIVSPQSPQEP